MVKLVIFSFFSSSVSVILDDFFKVGALDFGVYANKSVEFLEIHTNRYGI